MRQLLAEVDSAELAEWRAYFKLEPWGAVMDDRRHGILASLLANVNRDGRRHPEPYRETDFIYWHAVHREQPGGAVLKADPEEQSRLIKAALFKASGGN